MGAHWNCIRKVILMSTHNIGFYEEMAKIIFQLSSNTHFICSSVFGILLKFFAFHCFFRTWI